MDQGREIKTPPHIQGSDAFRPVKLVPREAEKVHSQGLNIHRDLACGLDAVGVKECAAGVGQGRQFRQGLDGAGFVIGQHDAHETGAGAERLFQVAYAHPAVFIHRQVGNRKALLFQPLAHLSAPKDAQCLR